MSLFASGAAFGLLLALLVVLFYQRRAASAAACGAMVSGDAAATPSSPPLSRRSGTPSAGMRAIAPSLPMIGGDEKYPALVHKAKDAILTTDAEGRIDFLNRSAQALFGYSLPEASGMQLDKLLPRKIEASPTADGRAGTVRAETVGRRKDGTEFPIELSLSKWESSTGTVSSAIVRDATERHRAEAYVRQSEANFRALIEQLPQGVLVHRDGLVVYVNTALRRLLKLKGARVTGSPLNQLYIPARPYTPSPVAGSTPNPRHRDSALRLADGKRLPVEATSLTVAFDGKPATVLIVKDVSEERALQAQMIFADRMASIGTLAAGVAHEVNNPLSYVLANLEFLRNDMSARALRKPEEARKLNEWTAIVVETREGVDRVRRIARDLKVLSRADDVQPTRMPLEAVVQTSLHLASTQLAARSRVIVDLPPAIEVLANEPRLVQVFLNLLVNAAQAMPNRPLQDNLVSITAEEHAGWVSIRIRDNGDGISEETRARIFEPFFTTKEIGVGTGLGLSISLDIIRSFGGELEVESKAGVGSEFCIRLRAANGAQNTDNARAPSVAA